MVLKQQTFQKLILPLTFLCICILGVILPLRGIINQIPPLMYNLPPHPEIPIYIMSPGKLEEKGMTDYLLSKNPQIPRENALLISQHYITESAAEMINHDIAFAQMLLETGFLKYGGAVNQKQFNFAGLGATDDGSQGNSFESEKMGIRAHIQHLKAYSSIYPLTNPCIDIRFEYVKRGSAETIFDLSGKWATDPDYGDKIYIILKKLFKLEY